MFEIQKPAEWKVYMKLLFLNYSEDIYLIVLQLEL